MSSSTGRCMLLLGLMLVSQAALFAQPPPQPRDNPIDQFVRERLAEEGTTRARPHHRFDDDPEGDPFALIQKRLADLEKKGKSRQDLQDLYKKLLKDPELLNRDPAMRKKLEDLINSSGMSLDPDDPRVKRLQDWLKRARTGSKNSPPLSPEAQEDLKRLLDAFKNAQGNKSDPPPIPDVPPPDPTTTDPTTTEPPPVLDEAEITARRQFTEWLLKQSRNLDDGRFRDSDLARQIRNDLSRFATNGAFRDGRRWAADSKLGERFADFTREMRSPRLWSNIRLPVPTVNLPKATLPSLPNLGGWGKAPSMGGLPGLGSPSMPSAQPPSGETVFWLLALGVAALIAWRVFKLYGFPLGRRPGAAIDLPWPKPGTVATRADLVRAFESLALAVLGRESRSWNHLEVAARLGGEASERRAAADTLAALYEQARYAPGDEPLAPDAFSAAQRSLTLLSGGAPS